MSLDFTIEHWIRSHGAFGIVNNNEVPRLAQSATEILKLLSDMQWHTAEEIRLVAGKDGIPASEGLRRMRDLRPILQVHGLRIVKKRHEGSRLFAYRIES